MLRIAIVGASHPHVDYVLDEIRRDTAQRTALIGVSDPDQSTAQRAAEGFDVPVFTNRDELLAQAPDVVMIAGRNADRGADVVAALHAGAEVICDKPLCTSLKQLADIEGAAAATGKSVTLLLEKRGYPETLAALEIVASGKLGDIVGITSSGPHKLKRDTRPAWFFDRELAGGIIGDLAVHDIDAAMLFAPFAEATITGAMSGTDERGFVRYGLASIVTPQTVISCEVNWLTPAASDIHGDYRLRLVGTRGTVEIFWARGRVEVTTDGEPTRDYPLPEGRRPAQDAIDDLVAQRSGVANTAMAIEATRLALLAQDSADHGGEPRHWARTSREEGRK